MADPVFTLDPDPSEFANYEEACRQWVLASSGLTTGQVIFAGQNGPRPTGTFAAISFGAMIPLGAYDPMTETYDGAADAGAEIVQVVRGQRELSVDVQVFSASVIGASSARAIASKIQASLGLPGIKDILHSFGITCFDNGRVQHVPAILDTKYEGRAILTARFYLEETVTSATGYITSAEVVNEADDPDHTFTVDAS